MNDPNGGKGATGPQARAAKRPTIHSKDYLALNVNGAEMRNLGLHRHGVGRRTRAEIRMESASES